MQSGGSGAALSRLQTRRPERRRAARRARGGGGTWRGRAARAARPPRTPSSGSSRGRPTRMRRPPSRQRRWRERCAPPTPTGDPGLSKRHTHTLTAVSGNLWKANALGARGAVRPEICRRMLAAVGQDDDTTSRRRRLLVHCFDVGYDLAGSVSCEGDGRGEAADRKHMSSWSRVSR